MCLRENCVETGYNMDVTEQSHSEHAGTDGPGDTEDGEEGWRRRKRREAEEKECERRNREPLIVCSLMVRYPKTAFGRFSSQVELLRTLICQISSTKLVFSQTHP